MRVQAWISGLLVTEFLGAGLSAQPQQGWQVTKGPDDLNVENISRDSSILDVKKDGFYSCMPPAELTRMQMELIKNGVFITQMDMIKSLGPGATSGTGFVVFDQEHSIWD
jgi:hypothetical protein